MNLGLFRRIPISSTPDTHADYQDQVDDLAFESQAFLQWIGIDVTGTGYVFEGDDKTAPMTPPSYGVDGFAMEAIGDFKDTNEVECDYHLAIGGGHDKRCGQAISAPSRYGAVYTNMPSYACSVLQTIAHEYFHMQGKGRQHSGSYKKGKYVFHDDKDCLMGGNKLVMPNAGHLCEVGLCEYKVIGKSQTVNLMPLELNERDMLPGHYRAVRIGDYYISIRKGVGIPFPIKYPDNLQIHEINVRIYGTEPTPGDAKYKKKYTYKHPEMRPGDSYTLPTGVVIEYVDYADEIAEVKITMEQKP